MPVLPKKSLTFVLTVSVRVTRVQVDGGEARGSVASVAKSHEKEKREWLA